MRPRTSLSVSAAVVARAHADIDVQLLVAEPTGGFGDLGVAASGELGDALDSFATLLRRRPTRSGGPDADVENAPGS